jgi:hypothetical protein
MLSSISRSPNNRPSVILNLNPRILIQKGQGVTLILRASDELRHSIYVRDEIAVTLEITSALSWLS